MSKFHFDPDFEWELFSSSKGEFSDEVEERFINHLARIKEALSQNSDMFSYQMYYRNKNLNKLKLKEPLWY